MISANAGWRLICSVGGMVAMFERFTRRGEAAISRRFGWGMALVLGPAHLTACTPGSGADDDSSASGGQAGTDGVSETGAGETVPSGETGAGETVPTGETGAGETVPTGDAGSEDGGVTDGGDATSADTEAPPLPAVCSEQDEGVSAAFDFDGEWFNSDGLGKCTVEAVGVEAQQIVTGLDCGTSVTLRIAAAAAGAPAWAVGDVVSLRTMLFAEPSFDAERQFELRSVDDELLAVGIDRETLVPDSTAPIAVDVSFPCGPEADDPIKGPVPMQIDFAFAGASLGLLPGHRGVLAIDATQRFAIDVERAIANDCCDTESGRWQHLLVRRVTDG